VGIGAQSPLWRRCLLRLFGSTYVRRKGRFGNEAFEAYVSPGSSLRVLAPRGIPVDPVHERFIREWVRPDSVVWDIGTNLGLFAFPAAIQASRGRVIGFEPDIEIVAQLTRGINLRANAGRPFVVLPIAVSDADEIAKYQVSRYSRAMSKLEAVGRWHQAQVDAKEVRHVVTMRIDALAGFLPPPTAIKIDVEGAEAKVLQGGEATIARFRPAILIEGPRELADEIGAFFRRNGYVMFDGASADRVALAQPVWDTIAVPAESLERAGKPAFASHVPSRGPDARPGS
jgi:FkbM family methyltransferase